MELIVPKLLWQHQDLTSNQTVMSFIQSLRDKGLVSMTTVLPLLSLDPETEKRNLTKLSDIDKKFNELRNKIRLGEKIDFDVENLFK